MEADWEVEIGGGAAAIDALWPGFVDLRRNPERIGEIAETAGLPALASLLVELNGGDSPLWTAKCDLWEPEPEATMGDESLAALACYIDLLPVEGSVFAQWQEAEGFCRKWVARLAPDAQNPFAPEAEALTECRVELVVREAVAGDAQGFGITAYLIATGGDRAAAAARLAAVFEVFAASILHTAPQKAASKLQ